MNDLDPNVDVLGQVENLAEPPSGLEMDDTSVRESIVNPVVGYVTVLRPEPGTAFHFTLTADVLEVNPV